MIHLVDEGILLSKLKYGETSLILSIFTEKHGIQRGLLKGGLKNKSSFEIGNILQVDKKSRTEENLGFLKVELQTSFLAGILGFPIKVVMLATLCRLIEGFILEKDSHEDFYQTTKAFLQFLSYNEAEGLLWKKYIKWEVILLQEIGFGLDLSKCVVSNKSDGLYYISPKTGKAVIKSVGDPYKDKLFVIPEFFNEVPITSLSDVEIAEGFRISTHFFNRFAHEYGVKIPSLRESLINKSLTKTKWVC